MNPTDIAADIQHNGVRRPLIEVARFNANFYVQAHDWAGWMVYHGLTITSRNDGGDIVYFANDFNAKAVHRLQITNPALLGNPPGVRKYLNVLKSMESDYDKAFAEAFYKKDATLAEKFAVHDAYMNDDTINGVVPNGCQAIRV
jgi:hypothetical protein